jgi:hypothetical protein
MSKTFPKKPLYIDKNVFTTTIIPSNNKDEIISLAKAGEYGKLEQILINMPVNSIFDNDILQKIIQTNITPIQKEKVIEVLLKKGVPINKLDEVGLPPIYYSVKEQSYIITKLLIQKNANLNITLPVGFDLFQTALVPSIKECPAQLINIKDQIDIGKYESQILEIEREFRKEILKLPVTKDIINDVLKFLENYNDINIKYIDLTTNTINTLDHTNQDQTRFIPVFENKIQTKLNSIESDLIKYKNYNETQLLEYTKFAVDMIKNEFNTTLNINLLNNFPKIDDSFPVEKNAGNYDYNDIYDNLFNFEEYDVDNIENILIDELNQYIQNINTEFNKYNTNISKKITEINNILIDPLTGITRYPPINFNEDPADIIDGNNISNYKRNYSGFIGGADGYRIILNIINDIKNTQISRINALPNNTIQEKLVIIRSLLYYYITAVKSTLYIIKRLPIYTTHFANNFLNISTTIVINKININKKVNELFTELMQLLQVNTDIVIKKFNDMIIKINNFSNIKILYKKYKLEYNPLFNNNFLLIKPYELSIDIVPDPYNNINQIGYWGENTELKLYNSVNPRLLNIALPPGDNMYDMHDFPESDDLDLFKNDDNTGSSLNLIIPTNLYHLKILLSIFHKNIYLDIDPNYNRIRDNFKKKNPVIEDNIIEKLTLIHLNTAITNTFKEIVNLAIFKESQKIAINIIEKTNHPMIKDDKFIKLLKNSLNKKDIKRAANTYNYYLDENYSNSEPIDIIPCLNNNVNLIKLLRKRTHVDLKQYQELLFKLAIPDLLNKDTGINKDKIKRNDLNIYLEKHKTKFITDITYLTNELKQKLKLANLEFFNISNYPLHIYIEPNSELTEFKFKSYTLNSIYDSLINDQKIANEYLIENIQIKLNNLFIEVIIPKTKEYLQFFVDKTIDSVFDTDYIKQNISPTVNNIIYEHLQIDPKKIKDSPRSLETIIDEFGLLFLNTVASQTPKNIPSLYNEKFKPNLIKFLEHMSQYYLNVYRNHLRYIFNKYRYERLRQDLG